MKYWYYRTNITSSNAYSLLMNVGLAIKYASVGPNRGIFDTQPRTSTEAYLILNQGIIILKIANFTIKTIGVYRF